MTIKIKLFDYQELADTPETIVNRWLKKFGPYILKAEIGKGFATFLYDTPQEVVREEPHQVRRIRNGREEGQSASRIPPGLEGVTSDPPNAGFDPAVWDRAWRTVRFSR